MTLITPSMRQMQLSKAHALTGTARGVNCFELDFRRPRSIQWICDSYVPKTNKQITAKTKQNTKVYTYTIYIETPTGLCFLFSRLEGYILQPFTPLTFVFSVEIGTPSQMWLQREDEGKKQYHSTKLYRKRFVYKHRVVWRWFQWLPKERRFCSRKPSFILSRLSF